MTRVSSARAITVALTSAALVSLPALASAAPARVAPDTAASSSTLHLAGGGQAASGPGSTSIRFLDFDHTRGWLSTTRIVGQVAASRAGRRGTLRQVHVRLYRKLDGIQGWHYLTTTRTGATAYPRFVFRAVSRGNAMYKVVFAGNADYQAARGTTRVLVHRAVPARLKSGSGNFHGRVRPHWSHRTVHLDRRRCGSCSWRKVRSARTGEHGHFRFTVPAPRTGRWWWRVSVPATTSFIWSYSGVFTTRLG